MIGKGLKKIIQQLLLIFCIPKKKKYFQIMFQFINHNSTLEITIIKWMIPNKEKEGWHYLAVKKLPRLLKEIASKQHGGFYCLNCLHSFQTEN